MECFTRVRDIAQAAPLHASLFNGQIPTPTTLQLPNGKYDMVDGKYEKTDWQARIMLALAPDALKTTNKNMRWAARRHGSWWAFVCTNVLPYWNGSATMSGNGFYKGKENKLMDGLFSEIKPGQQNTSIPIAFTEGRGAGATQGAVYSFGNFALNYNNKGRDAVITRSWEAGNSGRVELNLLHMSQIKSPSKRALFMEEGEATDQDNGTHHVQFVEYNTPIRRGVLGDSPTATGYIPGLGGGGIGKEKMEKIGFDPAIYEELTAERLELVEQDVMEGRHSGATLYGFFDGHAEAIPVETVGSLQLKPGDSVKDLKGPHGSLTTAADEDE